MATGIGQYGFGTKQYRYADAGKYYLATNPTAGTGIISNAQATYSDTKPYLLFKNNNSVSSGIKCYLDYLRLLVTVVGVGHTRSEITFQIDSSQSTTRYTSGGSAITPVNVNADSAASSGALIYAGAVTAAAAGAGRLLASIPLKTTAIEVVDSQWTFNFGDAPYGPPSPTGLTNAAAQVTLHHNLHPIVIGPQEHFAAVVWGGSMGTGITFAFQLGYVEV